MNAFTPFGKLEVGNTHEIARIAALPRRVWTEEAGVQLAAAMTRELRRPRGTMNLRPVQAIALYEAMECGGLFGPIRVGAGKSLLFALLPKVLDAKRPVLFLPAALLEKTNHEYRELAKHWYIATNQQLISYEILGLVQSAQKLDDIKPDYIGGDECHLWKNKRAGRTRRMVRYMRENPDTKVAAASGTVMKGSLEDFIHILRWCLKDNAPVPRTDDEAATWANALDERVNPIARRKPSALLKLGPVPTGVDGLTAARQVFQARLLETRGVVASSKTDGVTCSLRISALEYQPAKITEQHIANMRDGVTDGKGGFLVTPWTTPDGWSFSEALELRRYTRSLILGFHDIWSPRPPSEWLMARRDWASFAREVLSRSRTLDTELQVVNAVDAGDARVAGGAPALAAWREIRDTFKINPKPVWHDDSALKACVLWAEKEKGIVWTEQVAFARRLAEFSGCVYYGADGVNDAGESITHVKPGKAIIASVQANATGRNLQMFSTNLITSCPPGPATMEQLIGRTHRDGQEADTVTVDILLGCREHFDSFQRALDGAKAAEATLGHSQKLLLADLCLPSIANKTGPLWV